MRVTLVVPAAGSGSRLGLDVPKALVDLGGVPLLRRTLERLASAASFVETVVLAPSGDLARFEAAVRGCSQSLGLIRVTAGGETRQESVAAGLAALRMESDIVAVHDAARPLVPPQTVRAVIDAASESGASTAASRPADSVREDEDAGGSRALDRSRLWLVETPQAFRRALLEAAHREARRTGAGYTDDASLVEATGQAIRIVASEGRNLKVTWKDDLALAAEALRTSASR
jgi:2-C-methyl-D-erythritol 4-phosphate cytidylyltransferase